MSSSSAAPGLLGGQVALVTGSGQGVGEGLARGLASAGAAIVVATRRAETGQAVARAIAGEGGTAHFVRCDVTDRDDLETAVRAAMTEFGGLDIVVHNAISPAGPPRPVQAIDDGVIRGQIATAVTATYHCARASYPALRARPGTLMVVTSPAGVEGSANLPVYAAVKGAQRGIVKSLAREWGADGIRVNAIAPLARTPALEGAMAANPELDRRLRERTPMGRIGDPRDDVAPAAVFLASDMARYMTGQTIVVDGGGFMGL